MKGTGALLFTLGAYVLLMQFPISMLIEHDFGHGWQLAYLGGQLVIAAVVFIWCLRLVLRLRRD